MTAFMVILLPVRKRELSWRPARDASVSSELPRSDAVGRRLARRVVDAWEQLRSVALRARARRHVLARALPKGLLLTDEALICATFLCARLRECKEPFAIVDGRWCVRLLAIGRAT